MSENENEEENKDEEQKSNTNNESSTPTRPKSIFSLTSPDDDGDDTCLISNQKLTEGNKPIFDSGYSYFPIFYGTGSCDANNISSFENLKSSQAYTANWDNTLTPFSITGSSTNQYPLSTSGSFKVVYNVFNNLIQGNNYADAGTTSSFLNYTASENGLYKINLTLPITNTLLKTSPVNTMTWAVQVFKNGVNILETTKTFTATTVTSYAFKTSYVGYPNASDDYVNSDACVDSYSQYNTLYANANTLSQFMYLYTDPELTLAASSTGGRYIKITSTILNEDRPVIINSSGQITNIPNLCL